MIKMKKVLYKSFEGILAKEEDEVLKNKLSSSEKLRKKKLVVEKLRIMLASMKTGKFKPEFEIDLVNKIRYANYPQIFLHREISFAFRKFLYASILIIAFLLLFNLEENGGIKIISKEQVKLEEAISTEYFYSAEIFEGEHYGL